MHPANAIIANMASANNASDHSLLWGYPVELWDNAGIWALIIGAVLGVAALLLTTASAFVLYRVADKAQAELVEASKASAERLAANETETARARESAAKANERTAAAEVRLEEMRQKIGPRRIDENIFLAKLADVPKRKVLVSHAPDDPDSYFLATSLLGLLSNAQWDARYVGTTSEAVKMCGASLGGVLVLSKRMSPEEIARFTLKQSKASGL